MNHQMLLKLTAFPTLAGSLLAMLVMTSVGFAAESKSVASASCDAPIDSKLQSSKIPHLSLNRGILVASLETELELDFTAAESDAAVALFGCDCPSCINALRVVRSRGPQDSSKGHCFATMQERLSPSEVRSVLDTLEANDRN